jgi:hypothetical protein
VPRRLLSMILAGLLVTACGTAQPSPSPVTTPAPTPLVTPAVAPTASLMPSPAPTGPFAGQPYALDLPEGWETFDLSDPAGAAALDAFIAANPEMGAAVEAFKALPNVRMAVNLLLGNVMVSLATPTGGLPLDTIAASFTAQFAAVPGVVSTPEPDEIALPVGRAIHWDITLEANDPGGGTYQVGESVYLVANDTTAVLVEFVEVEGAGVPQEQQIIRTLRFTPQASR